MILLKAKESLREYFQHNLSQGTDIKVVWDASKAVIRSFFIQQNAIQRKEKGKKKIKIREEISKNEKELLKNPRNKAVKQNIKILQIQFSILLNQEIGWKIKMVKQRNFEFANKLGRMLAWQLKKKLLTLPGRKERERREKACGVGN